MSESYLEGKFFNTVIKAGRQIIETPYANSDDIGMIPNSFEGFKIVNSDISDTEIIVLSLNKWSGVDSPKPEKFNKIQDNGDAINSIGIIYTGIKDISLQGWNYDLSDENFEYYEVGYEGEKFDIALQYTRQGTDNTASGIAGDTEIGNLSLNIAYNSVDGTVSNGFGGGPFFTSGEDHTVDGTENQKATLNGAEYSFQNFTAGVTSISFDKGEDEMDYILSYTQNDKLTFDFILADMNDDGKLTRFFINYNF